MSNTEVKVNVSPDDKEWTLEANFEDAATDGDFCELLAIVLLQFCRMADLDPVELVSEAQNLDSQSLAPREELN